jgi:hypothetical protein
MMERSIDRKEHDSVKQVTTSPLTCPRKKLESDLEEKRIANHFIS